MNYTHIWRYNIMRTSLDAVKCHSLGSSNFNSNSSVLNSSVHISVHKFDSFFHMWRKDGLCLHVDLHREMEICLNTRTSIKLR